MESHSKYLIKISKQPKAVVDYAKRQLINQKLQVDEQVFDDELYFTVSATKEAIALKVDNEYH